jgi:Peptidase family M28
MGRFIGWYSCTQKLFNYYKRPLGSSLAALFLLGQPSPAVSSASKRLGRDQKGLATVAAINIRGINISSLNSLKQNKAFTWWSEFGDTLIVGGRQNIVQESAVRLENVWTSVSESDLRIIIAGHQNELPPSTIVIARSGHTALVVENSALEAIRKLPITSQSREHLSIRSFVPNTTYIQSAEHDEKPLVLSTQQKATGHAAMQLVDGARWFSDVEKLSSLNRHVSSPGLTTARNWIKEQFESLHPTSTVLQKFRVAGTDAWNVIATFDAGPNADIYIVGGHYDSVSEHTSEAAPGAEDNATGAAGVIELARVFAASKANATLVFIAFSGEEEGLVGSYAFVAHATPEFKARIKSVMTMDMIGYSKDATTDVLLETASEFSALTAQYAAAAKMVDGLTTFTSFNPWGSDHMPFIEKHIPAMLTIDNDWGDYPAYHRTNDTIDQVSREMGESILKMNAAVLAVMQERK